MSSGPPLQNEFHAFVSVDYDGDTFVFGSVAEGAVKVAKNSLPIQPMPTPMMMVFQIMMK